MKISEFWFFVQIQFLVNALILLGLISIKFKGTLVEYLSNLKTRKVVYLLIGFLLFNLTVFYSIKGLFYIDDQFLKSIYSNRNTPYFLIAVLLVLIAFILHYINISPKFKDEQKVSKLKKAKKQTDGTVVDSKFVVFTLLFLLVIGIICIFPYLLTSKKWLVDFCKDTGTLGDTIGGIMGPFVAIIAAFLTFIAFWVQYKANLAQNEQYNKQARDVAIERFENRFFKFIDYHRDNVEKMIYKRPNLVDGKVVSGKQYFVVLHTEMKTLLKKYFETNSKDEKQYTGEYIRNAINFIYYCLFYGMWPENREQIELKFKKKIDDFKPLGLDKIARYSKHYGVNSDESYVGLFDSAVKDKNAYPYYTGHVNRLGNYFRNIYQAIKYVDEQTFLNENEKYDYVKIIRAQMSAYEQTMLFYNSISDLGKPFELEHYNKSIENLEEEKKSILFKRLLITKYDLVRNTQFIDKSGAILEKGAVKINISDFYPLLCSEQSEECTVTGVLPFKNNKDKICRFCFNEKYIGYQNDDAEEKIREFFTKTIIETKYKKKEDFCNEVDCNSWDIMEKIKLGK